jgi:hypothetical protein
MESTGRSDAGAHLGGWLIDACFDCVDPGERRLAYTGVELGRQLPYVTAVFESTLAEFAAASDATEERLRAGVADLRALGATPRASLGWTVHKAKARP